MHSPQRSTGWSMPNAEKGKRAGGSSTMAPMLHGVSITPREDTRQCVPRRRLANAIRLEPERADLQSTARPRGGRRRDGSSWRRSGRRLLTMVPKSTPSRTSPGGSGSRGSPTGTTAASLPIRQRRSWNESSSRFGSWPESTMPPRPKAGFNHRVGVRVRSNRLTWPADILVSVTRRGVRLSPATAD